MSVFVSVEDKEGEQLAPVFDISRVQRHFRSVGDSICLRFISEEHDASFNPEQIPILLEELRLVGSKELKKEEEREEIDRVIRTVEKAAKSRGTYVKFYGERHTE